MLEVSTGTSDCGWLQILLTNGSGAEAAVLNSLPSISSQRSYDRDPSVHRLVRLRASAAVQQDRCDTDAGLLSPEFAAGIGRVNGAKNHGTRVGNWLTVEQGRALLSTFDRTSLRGCNWATLKETVQDG